ncbi:major facilitator superfamily domain-containing protein [Aspergillus varians]
MPAHELSESSPLDQGSFNSSEHSDCGISEPTRRRLIITLIIILLAFEIGGQMIPGPMVRVIESIVCDRYWRAHGLTGHIPERRCNIPAVQTEVATVKGYSDLLEGLLCTICAIPYGLLADRYGRRRAIRLTVPGFLLNALITNSVLWFSDTFPLRAIWLASFSWIIGGGPTVALVIIWTMLADLSTDSKRAMLFFHVGLASQIAGFLASAISSGLMALNPWIPLPIGCATVTVGLGFALSLPETMSLVVKTRDATMCWDENELVESIPNPPLRYIPLARKIERLIHPYLFIFNSRLLLLMLSFAVFQVAQGSAAFLTQYISTRFSWTLVHAQLLTSLHAAATIPVFAFLLPYFSEKVLYSLSLPRRDLHIARFSIVSLTVGSLGTGLSSHISLLVPSLCLHALGAGFALAIRSLVTSLVKREESARLYSAIEILQSMGSVLGSLCFTNAFKSGLLMDGIGSGLVWVLSSFLFAFVGTALMTIRV